MNKNRVFAITKRKLRSLAGDPRTLVFVCVMPAVMMLLFGFAIGGQPTNLAVIGVGDHPGKVIGITSCKAWNSDLAFDERYKPAHIAANPSPKAKANRSKMLPWSDN